MTDRGPTRRLRGLGGLGRRAGWVVADSALSSLANAGLTIGLARVVSSTDYGAFALAFTVYSLVIAVSQSATNQVVVVRYAAAEPTVQRSALSSALGLSVCLAAGAALATVGAALLVGAPVRGTLTAMAVVLPALLVQDVWRSAFIAYGRPSRAFLNDLVWVSLWASAFVVLVLVGVSSAPVFVLAWGASAIVAAALASSQSQARPRLTGGFRWFVLHRDIALPAMANTLAILGALQVAFVLISVVGTVEDLGALRGAQTLLGPLNIIGFAATSFAVPEIVRRDLGTRGLVVSALALSGILAGGAAVWGTILLLLPDAAGRELLGATWPQARESLPGMVIYTCAINATVGATAVMRAMDRVLSAFWVSVMLGPLVLILSVVGVAWGGAQGAAVGFAVAGLAVIPPCWVLLVRDARLGRRTPVA